MKCNTTVLEPALWPRHGSQWSPTFLISPYRVSAKRLICFLLGGFRGKKTDMKLFFFFFLIFQVHPLEICHSLWPYHSILSIHLSPFSHSFSTFFLSLWQTNELLTHLLTMVNQDKTTINVQLWLWGNSVWRQQGQQGNGWGLWRELGGGKWSSISFWWIGTDMGKLYPLFIWLCFPYASIILKTTSVGRGVRKIQVFPPLNNTPAVLAWFMQHKGHGEGGEILAFMCPSQTLHCHRWSAAAHPSCHVRRRV